MGSTSTIKGTIQVKAAKGKVKISGTVNGVKVTVTSQLLIGEAYYYIPAAARLDH